MAMQPVTETRLSPQLSEIHIWMAIGAVVAVSVAGMLDIGVRSSEFYEFGALLGVAAAFITTLLIACIF